MRITKDKVKKILVVRNDRFGEFLLNIPALAALKKYFSLAKITLIVRPEVEELAKRIPSVDDILVWDSLIRHCFLEKIRLLKEIMLRKFDLAIMLNPSKEFNIITYLSGIPLRLGYDRKGGFMLNYKIEDKKSQGSKHEVDYNLELIKVIGIDFDSSDISFPLEIRKEDFPDLRLAELGLDSGNFIVMHPWASNRDKEWPITNYRELFVKLSCDFGLKCVLVGGKEEVKRAEEFRKDLPLIDVTAKTTLIELAGLLKRSKLLVTNDSGPMHLAVAVGTPVAAIFRKSPASVSAKRWGPIGRSSIVIENDSILNIKVSEVLDGIKKILKP